MTYKDSMSRLPVRVIQAQALADLQAVYDLQDDTLERVVSYDTDDKGQMINIVTETIPAPMPKWKRMGFESRAAVMELRDTWK